MEIFSKFDSNWIGKKVDRTNLPERYCFLMFGTYIYALAFTLFFEPYDVVVGGTAGISLIFKEYFNINPSLFVLVFSLLLLVISYFLLGKKATTKTVVGLLVLPLFMQATSIFSSFIDLENTSMLALMIYGGLLLGYANGIIVRTGFSLGGVQTLCQIISKYARISYGKANLIVNTIIILIGSFTFGITNALYAIISLYVSSLIMDKVILGISDSKAFYIVTSKEKEVRDFIIKELGHSATLLEGKGGYSLDNLKVILCVIPTREYVFVRDVIEEIDNKAFYIITDAYEVKGGI